MSPAGTGRWTGRANRVAAIQRRVFGTVDLDVTGQPDRTFDLKYIHAYFPCQGCLYLPYSQNRAPLGATITLRISDFNPSKVESEKRATGREHTIVSNGVEQPTTIFTPMHGLIIVGVALFATWLARS
jgi:hypothetical protein